MKLPTVDEAGAIAVEIADGLSDKLNAKEASFFVAGFQEAIKYLNSKKGQTEILANGSEVIDSFDSQLAYLGNNAERLIGEHGEPEYRRLVASIEMVRSSAIVFFSEFNPSHEADGEV